MVMPCPLRVRLEISVPSHADWMLAPFRGDSVTLSLRGATVCPSDFDSLLTDSAVVAVSARQEPGRAVLAGHRRRPDMQARCTSSGALLSLVFDRFPPPVIPLRPVLRIMLDAGHGGVDAGARSADGTAEKDITLSAARMVATRLNERHRDIEVLLTRETDILLPSTLRVEQANSRAADAFISLHCNWSFDKSLRGLRAGFSSPGSSGRSSGVVAGDGVVWPDDSGSRASGGPAGGIARWDNAHDSWIPLSQSLAGSVSDAAQGRGIPTRQPLQAPLAILEGLSMPGIMIELGYLSNPVEARDLVTLDYLEGLADAVVEGISRFVASSRQPEGQQ
ncbi:MAG: N-acetylmuramoyl-L-alanine amidase [Candidatus Eisenbacteria bacterium]|nr:N-acetylmuramoyl-L-alanine amidase [Candidatus Eisenbacteria bacterium]